MHLDFETAVLTNARLARFAASAWLARLRGPLHVPARLLSAMRRGRADRLLIAPQDIRTADAIAAEHIYSGHFALAGKVVSTHGHSPFLVSAPSQAWSEALHGFGWLRHLRAADTALSRANARALVEDWLNLDARGAQYDSRTARAPRIVARRLIAWLSHSPIILEGADHGFYRRFVRAIDAHGATLRRALASGLDAEARPIAIIAMTQVGLCLEGASATLQRGSLMLARELSKQILSDGGHVSRNPRILVELLVDLLPTRQAYVARGAAAPEPLLNAIDRMTPMLRMFRHADGALALFNGMSASEPETLATLLAHGDSGATPILDAPYSGYQRLEAEGTIVVADVGGPPPMAFSREAHAGCLAFELSSLFNRLIVNCGAPAAAGEAREAARASAAHSTLTIDNRSSCRFAPAGSRSITAGLVVEGPSQTKVSRWVDEAGGQSIEARHNGYASRFGVVHQRKLRLAGDGGALHGEDRLSPAGRTAAAIGKPVLVRFHVHPSVRVEPDARTGSLILKSPSGEEWRFESPGRDIDVQESIFFAAPGGPRPTVQIVVRTDLTPNELLSWSFIRSRLASGVAVPPDAM